MTSEPRQAPSTDVTNRFSTDPSRVAPDELSIIVRIMEALQLAVVFCDSAGRPVGISAAAAMVLDRGSAVSMRDGRLCCADAASEIALQAAMARAARAPGDDAGSTRLCLKSAGKPLLANVAPAPRGPGGLSTGAVVLVAFDVGRPPALHARDDLVAAYGLTIAEAEVAIALAWGRSVTEISLQRRVRTSTLRSQIAAALAKTHTTRQAELIALVARWL